jgi:hypothetical protein
MAFVNASRLRIRSLVRPNAASSRPLRNETSRAAFLTSSATRLIHEIGGLCDEDAQGFGRERSLSLLNMLKHSAVWDGWVQLDFEIEVFDRARKHGVSYIGFQRGYR